VRSIRDLNTFSSSTNFSLQQTSDNTQKVKEIERRVQSLSGVLASPISEDDYAEKGRRVELRRFVLVRIRISFLTPLSGSSRGLSLNLNRYPNGMRFCGTCATPIMPKL
jgi:hypothetical protein